MAATTSTPPLEPPAPPGLPSEIRVVVSGMHRSGTSLLARIVELLGVSLGRPDDLLPPGDDNRAGYFEHRAVKAFDDELLAALGGSWDRPPLLEAGWTDDPSLAPWRDRAAQILAEGFGPTGHDEPIGVKDPRLSLLLPFWRSVVPIRASIVLVRDPREVAASLAARRFRVDGDTAAALWLRYLYSAARSDPDHLLVVHRAPFEALDATIDRIVAHLGLPDPDDRTRARIATHVNPTLFNQRADTGDAAPSGPLEALALRVWNDGAVALDAITDDLATALAEGHLQPHAHVEDATRARADAASYKSQLKARNEQVRRLERRIEQLSAERATQPSGAATGPAVAATVPPSPDATAALFVPDDLYLHALSRARLAERLRRIDHRFEAVVAPLAELPPGTTVTTHAERSAIAPPPLRPFLDASLQGAVAARSPGTAQLIDATTVALASPIEALEDRSIPVHHLWRADADTNPPLQDASSQARPPFPQRLVTVFLGTQADDDIDDIARAWVNDLVRLGVDARLAVPEPPPGLHLSAPCAPSQASLAELRPDAVIALDDGALDLVAGAPLPQTPVVARLSHDSVDRVVTGTSKVRGTTVHAHVGRRSGARAIHEALARLTSGPGVTRPPAPRRPVDDDEPPAADRPDSGSFAVVPEPPGAADPHARLLAASLREVEITVQSGLRALRHAGRFTTAVTILEAGRPGARLDRLVTARAAAGLTTIVRVSGHDVVADRDAPDGIAGLHEPAASRVRAARRALVPTPAIARHLDAIGVATAVVPPALDPGLLDRLAELGSAPRRGPAVIGWIVDPGSAAPSPATAAVADALARLLAEDPTVHLEVHAPAKWEPGALGDHPRTTVDRRAPRTDTLARWSGQVWSPSTRQVAVLGHWGPLVEAAAAGLPTVLSRGDVAHVGTLTDASLVVTDRLDDHEWHAKVASLRDPGQRAVLADRVRQLGAIRLGAAARRTLRRRVLELAAATPHHPTSQEPIDADA